MSSSMSGSGILSLFRFELMDMKSRPMKADYIPPLDDDSEIIILMVWGTLFIAIIFHFSLSHFLKKALLIKMCACVITYS